MTVPPEPMALSPGQPADQTPYGIPGPQAPEPQLFGATHSWGRAATLSGWPTATEQPPLVPATSHPVSRYPQQPWPSAQAAVTEHYGYALPSGSHRPTNTLAVWSWILAVPFALLSLVFGIVAVRRAQERRGVGSTHAVVGVTLSSTMLVLALVGVLVAPSENLEAMASAVGIAGTSGSAEPQGGATGLGGIGAATESDSVSGDYSSPTTYLAYLEDRAPDTFQAYPNEDLVTYATYACHSLDRNSVQETLDNTGSMFGLDPGDAGAVVGAAVLGLCAQYTTDVQRYVGNDAWGV